MTESEANSALTLAVQDALNVQAFMCAEPMDCGQLEAPDESCLYASISYSGHLQGMVELLFPESLARELAANIMGTSVEELDADGAEDALKELLNITCGQYLTRRYGTGPVFDMEIPRVEQLPAGAWEDWRHKPGVMGLDVDYAPVLISLRDTARDTNTA